MIDASKAFLIDKYTFTWKRGAGATTPCLFCTEEIFPGEKAVKIIAVDIDEEETDWDKDDEQVEDAFSPLPLPTHCGQGMSMQGMGGDAWKCEKCGEIVPAVRIGVFPIQCTSPEQRNPRILEQIDVEDKVVYDSGSPALAPAIVHTRCAHTNADKVDRVLDLPTRAGAL